ncbi:MAG: outer membrane beta-barrel protein [Chthoniobacterales bacterium]
MTKGDSQGTLGNHYGRSRNNWLSTRRKMSPKWSRPALSAFSLAVFAALHPTFSQAAEEAWPETTPMPTARPIEAAAPLAPDAINNAAAAIDVEEPPAPGEGPAATSEIDTIAIGSGGAPNFWKPEIHAGVTASVVFDDNIFITHENEVSDTIFVTSARMTLAFGNVESWASRFIDTTARALDAEDEGTENLIALTYAPTASFFADNNTLNSVDHDVAGTVRWTFNKLRVAFDGRFQTLSDPDEDLGRRADRQVTNLHLTGIYDWSEKTRVQLEGTWVNRDYNVGNDSSQAEANGYFLFDVTPKTTIGFGFGAGELEQDQNPNQTYERAVARFRYNSYSKLTLSLVGGVELRQTDGGDDVSTGVFQVDIGYTPTDSTGFFLTASRRIEPSANVLTQGIERTTFGLIYNQRLLQKLSLSTNLEYTLADYTTSGAVANESRSDDLWRFSMTLTFEVTQNGFVRLGYAYRENDSSREVVSYKSNQVILSATVLF